MNILKKIYCRTFQFALRSALPVLPYREPKRLESIKELPKTLKSEKVDSVLMVTDSGVRKCGLTLPLEKLLKENNIKICVYDKTVPNPTSDNVETARQLYLTNNCKAVIGFGGGSSIDCAKGVAARVAKPKQSLKKMGGVLKVHHKLPLIFAIPTTAGTGSEVTLAAVISDSQTHHKYAITDFSLIPHYAVLDPELTRSLPKHLTAETALDALTHAVEAYIGQSTTKETRKCAIYAIKLIYSNLYNAWSDGNDIDARRNLLKAAYLAGKAFSKSYVGYVHAIAHSLSGKYNLPHGYTNAVLLPYVLHDYGNKIHKKLATLAKEVGLANSNDSEEILAEKFIQSIRDMNECFGIPTYFKELKAEDIPELAKTADKEANPLYPVPVLMNAKTLENIYKEVVMSNSKKIEKQQVKSA